MIRIIFNAFLCGAAFKVGVDTVHKLKNPQVRANLKTKFNKIKDIITDKQN